MRTSIVVAVLVVLGVAAGGGYYALQVYPQQQFQAGLDQALATLPPGTTATYKSAHYSVLSHQAVVTGLAVHGEIPGDPPQPFDVAVDSIETENPNLDFPGSWAGAIANPASYTPDRALQVADSLAMKRITVHSAMIDMTEESVRIAKLRLFPWALLHDGMPSWKELQGSLASRSRPAELADLRPMLRAEAAAMLGVAYDNYEAGTAKAAEALPGTGIAYAIRKMAGSGFDRGVMQGATGEGIAFSGNAIGAFTVDRVAMGALDVREPMTRLVNGDALSPALLDGIRIGRIEYAGITAQPRGEPAVHIGGLSIGPVAFAHGMPVSGELGWTDISVSKSQLKDNRIQDAFNKLGLETITVSFALAYDWDVAQKRAAVHDTMLKVNELGTITISAGLTNVVPGVDAWSEARLEHVRLRFEDASLVDRLLRAGAAETGADPAAYRQQIAGMVRQQSRADSGGGPALQAAGDAAGDFVTSPHSLTIELSPPAPVPLMALVGAIAAPARSAAMLGLVVSANQK